MTQIFNRAAGKTTRRELREEYFKALNLTILRFINQEVAGNIVKVITKIADVLGVTPWEE